jgi:putative endonuclease
VLPRRALYIGMTSNLMQRVYQHKTHESEGFTDSYNSVRLVYWESFDEVIKAINREKQLKNWRREKKLWLIARTNPKSETCPPTGTAKKASKHKRRRAPYRRHPL